MPVSILSVYNTFVTLLLSLSLLGMCPVSFTLDSKKNSVELNTAVYNIPEIYKQICIFIQRLYICLCLFLQVGTTIVLQLLTAAFDIVGFGLIARHVPFRGESYYYRDTEVNICYFTHLRLFPLCNMLMPRKHKHNFRTNCPGKNIVCFAPVMDFLCCCYIHVCACL